MLFLQFAALASMAVAYPGMKAKRDHSGIFKALIERAGERLMERQGGPPVGPVAKLGNLADKGTATNNKIMACFNSPNGGACTSTETYEPPTKDTPECAKDTCCIWSYIKDDLVPLFQEADGTCSDIARNAIRFGFHDAGAWDAKQTHGGADGSLLLSADEVSRTENAGLAKGKAALLPIYLKYKSYGISAADLLQFAHNVAVVTCPLGPRSLTFVGRPDWKESDGPNPTGLLPDARSPADVNLDLFANKTIGTVDLVALLGAHTTAKQFFFDTAKSGMPMDTTPGVWDVAFYSEVLRGEPQCGVFRLPSDTLLGNSSTSTRGFQAFADGFPSDTGSGQNLWNGLYSRGYLRLSLLGVKDIQGLTDCSKVLPADVPTFQKPPSALVTCPVSSSSTTSTTSTASTSSSTTTSSAVTTSLATTSGLSSDAGLKTSSATNSEAKNTATSDDKKSTATGTSAAVDTKTTGSPATSGGASQTPTTSKKVTTTTKAAASPSQNAVDSAVSNVLKEITAIIPLVSTYKAADGKATTTTTGSSTSVAIQWLKDGATAGVAAPVLKVASQVVQTVYVTETVDADSCYFDD